MGGLFHQFHLCSGSFFSLNHAMPLLHNEQIGDEWEKVHVSDHDQDEGQSSQKSRRSLRPGVRTLRMRHFMSPW